MLGVTGPLYNIIILILLFCLSDEFLNAQACQVRS